MIDYAVLNWWVWRGIYLFLSYHTNIPEWLVGVINRSLHLAGPGVKLVLPPVPELVQQVSRIPPEAAKPWQVIQERVCDLWGLLDLYDHKSQIM